MNITVLEASNYFRGLLLLIRKDRRIAPSEIELMKRIGRDLGFEEEFCDNAFAEILDNRFILDEPPVFASQELSMKFVRDGCTLAYADGELHPHEEQFLRSTAKTNHIEESLLLAELDRARTREGLPARLEADGLTVVHS
jgi:hypothetical protein